MLDTSIASNGNNQHHHRSHSQAPVEVDERGIDGPFEKTDPVSGITVSGTHNLTVEQRNKHLSFRLAMNDVLPLPDQMKWSDEDIIFRFLIARQWKEKDAAAALREYSKWRVDNEVDRCMEETFEPAVMDQMHGYHGTDNEGCPVYYDQPQPKQLADLVATQPREQLIKWHVVVAELGRKKARDLGVDRITAVVDLTHVGMGLITNKKAFGLLRECSHIDQHYYPENMRVMCLVNAPGSFKWMWRAVKVMLEERVQKKIQVLAKIDDMAKFIPLERVPVEFGGLASGFLTVKEEFLQMRADAEAQEALGPEGVAARSRTASVVSTHTHTVLHDVSFDGRDAPHLYPDVSGEVPPGDSSPSSPLGGGGADAGSGSGAVTTSRGVAVNGGGSMLSDGSPLAVAEGGGDGGGSGGAQAASSPAAAASDSDAISPPTALVSCIAAPDASEASPRSAIVDVPLPTLTAGANAMMRERGSSTGTATTTTERELLTPVTATGSSSAVSSSQNVKATTATATPPPQQQQQQSSRRRPPALDATASPSSLSAAKQRSATTTARPSPSSSCVANGRAGAAAATAAATESSSSLRRVVSPLTSDSRTSSQSRQRTFQRPNNGSTASSTTPPPPPQPATTAAAAPIFCFVDGHTADIVDGDGGEGGGGVPQRRPWRLAAEVFPRPLPLLCAALQHSSNGKRASSPPRFVGGGGGGGGAGGLWVDIVASVDPSCEVLTVCRLGYANVAASFSLPLSLTLAQRGAKEALPPRAQSELPLPSAGAAGAGPPLLVLHFSVSHGGMGGSANGNAVGLSSRSTVCMVLACEDASEAEEWLCWLWACFPWSMPPTSSPSRGCASMQGLQFVELA